MTTDPQPYLILAGMPRQLHNRVKKRVSVRGWSLILIPSVQDWRSHVDKSGFHRALQQATRLNTNPNSPYIFDNRVAGQVLAFSAQSDRAKASENIRDHIRLRWLNVDLLSSLPDDVDSFNAALQREANFELDWRDRIRPAGNDSPLLLPQCAFSPRRFGSMWADAGSVGPGPLRGSGMTQLERVRRDLAGFATLHRRRGYWLDAREIRFEATELHGVPADPRWRWKFSWCVPEGFHYNVMHERNFPFTVRQFDRTVVSVNRAGYLNVDCHGRCR